MGEAPTTADAAVYAHVANVLGGLLVSPVKEYGRGLPNLLAYCDRMRARFFPDLPEDVVA
jgi:glutathione S-transferase